MNLEIDPAELEPIIAKAIEATLVRVLDGEVRLGTFGNRLAYSEAEAAELIGVPSHVLRDERLRGRINARKVGRSYRYAREELRRYLMETDR